MSDGADDSPLFAPWGRHGVDGPEPAEIGVGPLRLHVAGRAGEIHLAHGHGESTEELEWTRWALDGWTGEIGLVPAFHDRPLVVEPEDTFWLTRGAEARIYVRVPLWVRVEALGERSLHLTTLPSVESSDTWWGTLGDGELSYWLRTHARRAVTPELFEPHLAICPLQLVNDADEDLHVEKIALRVAYLSLYMNDGRELWSDATRVLYTGHDEGSRLEMAGHPPREAPDARLAVPPAERMGRGFRARTFARFRTIQGWI